MTKGKSRVWDSCLRGHVRPFMGTIFNCNQKCLLVKSPSGTYSIHYRGHIVRLKYIIPKILSVHYYYYYYYYYSVVTCVTLLNLWWQKVKEFSNPKISVWLYKSFMIYRIYVLFTPRQCKMWHCQDGPAGECLYLTLRLTSGRQFHHSSLSVTINLCSDPVYEERGRRYLCMWNFSIYVIL